MRCVALGPLGPCVSTYNMQGPNIKPNFVLKKLPAAMVFKNLFFGI